MTLNEALIRQNFINKILIKDDVDKNLKVKIMMMRIELNKIKNQFDNDCIEMIKQLQTEEFLELNSLEKPTEKQKKRLEELNKKLTDEYNQFLIEKGKEEVKFDKKFTEDEYAQIVDVNSENDIDINGSKLDALSFLEIIYTLFVE
jgi:hypothetical protein